MFKSIYQWLKGFDFHNLFGDKDLKVPRLIFFVGLLSVVLIASYANYSLNEKDRYRFKILSKAVIDTIFDRLDIHLIVLRGVAGIFHEKNSLTFEGLDKYVESVELERFFPGSVGIGFLPKVYRHEAAEFSEKIRNEYYPQFNIQSTSDNEFLFPVAYISPYTSQNQKIIGYDMLSEEKRRSAMLKAAETGRASLTNKINILRHTDSDEEPGFHVYLPIYFNTGKGGADGNVKNMSTLAGFVFSPILSKDFFREIFKKDFEKYVNVQITDHSSGTSETIFAEGAAATEECTDCEVIDEDIDILGNHWTLTFASLPAFYSGSNKIIVFILCVGQLILVFVISALSYTQNQAKIRAETANSEKEELLRRERIARGQAEQASRLKEEFLATVSHELRNPLNAILGWAQIINRPQTSNENIQKGIKTIEKNVHVQAKLIDDLLEMSRITTGKLILDIKNTDIPKVVDSALETVDSAIKAKNIKIVKNIDTPLPLIKADETRLQQVIWNLLSNAIKFSPEGSTIQISIQKIDGAMVFGIKDEGPGISPDFLPNIFDRFRQENSKITRKHGGLGLGLAITKSLIELHGGEIDVKSEGIGKGAEFTFRIPIRTDSFINEQQSSGLGESETYGKKSMDEMSILVIDDEPDTREMLKVLMNEKGAKVEAVSSVDEALEKINSNEYDVVISDIGMPDKDGYELARNIRNHQSRHIRITPIIALSAYARENDRNLSREAGFSAHLAKPLNVNELFQMIQNLV
jgi:signal transduction histidine kinase